MNRKAGEWVLWSKLFDGTQEPSITQIQEYVDTPLWMDLTAFLQETCQVQPTMFYSGCTMQNGAWEGWNVKYKKSGRVLCTLYPKKRYFVALIAVGEKQKAEADLLIPLCDAYTQAVYSETTPGYYGKSLGIEVTSESILRDVISLIALRAGNR